MRLTVALAGLLATGLLLVPLSDASKPSTQAGQSPQPLVFGSWFSIQIDSRVEKQSWFLDCCNWDPNHTIVSPGVDIVGTWDINDHVESAASGYLDAGASAITSWKHTWDWDPIYGCKHGLCAYWSSNSNFWGDRISAPSADLLVSTCFVEQARCFQSNPIYDTVAKVYRYWFCGQVLYSPDDPTIVDIPGSNALDGTPGRGVTSHITFTVTNPNPPGNRSTVKNIQAGWGLSSDVIFPAGCADGDSFHRVPIDNASYPFEWSAS